MHPYVGLGRYSREPMLMEETATYLRTAQISSRCTRTMPQATGRWRLIRGPTDVRAALEQIGNEAMRAGSQSLGRVRMLRKQSHRGMDGERLHAHQSSQRRCTSSMTYAAVRDSYGMTASISCGPGRPRAASAAVNSSAVVARRAGTPMPVASATKSSRGGSRASMASARGPGVAAAVLGTHPLQFQPQDVVGAVVVDHRGDVELFAGQVHSAAACTSPTRRPEGRAPSGPARTAAPTPGAGRTRLRRRST